MRQKSYLSVLLAGAVCFSAFVASAAAVAKIEVADGQTYELAADAAANAVNCVHQSGTLLVLGEGCTVKLTGTAATEGDDFVLRAGIKCASGDFTIDGTELVNYSKTLKWRGSAIAGCANVTGFEALRFGTEDAADGSSIHRITFAADVKGVPVVFGSSVYMNRTPVSTTFSYESGALLWPGSVDAKLHEADNVSTNEFGALEVEGWNFGLLVDNLKYKQAIPYAKVRVHGSNYLSFRPCGVSVSETDVGSWGGSTGGGYDCDIELVDAGTWLESNHSRLGYLKGDISGAGSVLIRNAGPIYFDGRLTYTGATTFASTGSRIVIADSEPKTEKFFFDKPGSVEFTAPMTTINRIESSEANSFALLPEGGELNVKVVAGRFAFTNTTGKVIVDKIEGDKSIITVDDGAEILVKDCDAGAIIKVMSESATIGFGEGTHASLSLTGSDMPEVEITVTSGRFDFATDFRYGGCEKLKTVRVTGTAEALVPVHCPFEVIAAGGKVIRASASSGKIAFWGDADKASSYVTMSEANKQFTESDTAIAMWKDCREGVTDWSFAWTRWKVSNYKDGTATVWNDYLDNALNGRRVITMPGVNRRLSAWSGQELNWTADNPNRSLLGRIPSEYAIVVAKKASATTGHVMLGDYDRKLSRPEANTAALFTNENVTVYRNGVWVESPTTTSYTTDWTVYSYSTDHASIIGLCTDDPTTNKGGYFDIAEVMIFSEVPTEFERVTYENYLAAKWGLTVTHTPEEEALVNTIAVTGSGELSLTEPKIAAVDVSDFVGKITLTDLFDSTDTVAFTVGGGDEAPFTITQVAIDRDQKKLVVDFALPNAPQPRVDTVYDFFTVADGWTMEVGTVTNPQNWNYQLSTEDGVTTFCRRRPGLIFLAK